MACEASPTLADHSQLHGAAHAGPRTTAVSCAKAILLALISAAVACVGSLAGATRAVAAFPGANGVIAYSDFTLFANDNAFHIWVVNPDGSGRRQLTFAPNELDEHPHFSPDGQLIVFNRTPDRPSSPVNPAQTWVMAADGSGAHPIGPPSGDLSNPSFTADGRHILFQVTRGTPDEELPDEIWEMNLDGSNAHGLIPSPAFDASASPDGTRIAYHGGIDGLAQSGMIANSDGRAIRPGPHDCADGWSPDSRLLVCPNSDTGALQTAAATGLGQPTTIVPGGFASRIEPTFSPDGTEIAFKGEDSSYPPHRSLYTVAADASNPTNTIITEIVPFADAPGQAPEEPDWQPIPVSPSTSATILVAAGAAAGSLARLSSANPTVAVRFRARRVGTISIELVGTTFARAAIASKRRVPTKPLRVTPTVVAQGRRRIARSGRTTVIVKLTAAGKRLLSAAERRHRGLTLLGTVTFRPRHGRTIARAIHIRLTR